MSKKSVLPQSPRHILVYDEDWDFLMQHYGPGSAKPLGVSRSIREIIHQRVLGLKAKQVNALDRLRDEDRPTGDPEIKL